MLTDGYERHDSMCDSDNSEVHESGNVGGIQSIKKRADDAMFRRL